MKQIQFSKFKDYTNQKVNFIQPKLDGHLTKIRKTIIGDIYAWTKNDNEITNKLLAIKHIAAELNYLPNDSIIFAELHCPGVAATSIPTLLNDADERLQLTVFAAPLFNSEGCSNKPLNVIMLYLKIHGLKVSETIIVEPKELAPRQISPHWQKKLLEEARETGLEGWVLKESHMTGWYKLKPVKTLDAFVIGTQQSFSSTHYGGLQSITIGVWRNAKVHNLGEVGGGFKLEFRKQLDTKEKRDALLNKVCEVRYDSLAAKGKLRWPRFIRWRDDKSIGDCLWSQLEN